MAATLAPGTTAGVVAAAGLAALPDSLRDVATSYGLGGTVGLAQCDGIEIRPGSEDPIPAGAVVSLTCCALAGDSPSVASALVHVEANGSREVAAVKLA
jgi:hypothetical protein